MQSAKLRSAAGFWRWQLVLGAIAAFLALPDQAVRADEGGVSFWIPGFFGSLAAVPAQAPGWSVTSIYYHTYVFAGGDVEWARAMSLGGFTVTLSTTMTA